MAVGPGVFNNVAPLRNVAAMVALIERVEGRSFGLPGMATFYGPSGFGKTTAAVFAANQFQAYNVQVKSAWTAKKLASAILFDMGIKPDRTVADMVDQIGDALGKCRAPLIIDEANFLVDRGVIEVVRDIYESSGATIILIGDERLPQKLQKWEQVHGRMLDWVAAQPGDAADVTHLARIHAAGIEIAPDLRQHLLQVSARSIRRICINLDRLAEFARTRGLSAVTLADWGRGDFFSGEAPHPRRDLAAAARRVA